MLVSSECQLEGNEELGVATILTPGCSFGHVPIDQFYAYKHYFDTSISEKTGLEMFLVFIPY